MFLGVVRLRTSVLPAGGPAHRSVAVQMDKVLVTPHPGEGGVLDRAAIWKPTKFPSWRCVFLTAAAGMPAKSLKTSAFDHCDHILAMFQQNNISMGRAKTQGRINVATAMPLLLVFLVGVPWCGCSLFVHYPFPSTSGPGVLQQPGSSPIGTAFQTTQSLYVRTRLFFFGPL